MNKVEITSGSDATLQFAFKDGAGTALSVSDPAVITADGALENRLTTTLTDGAGGLVSVLIEGTDPMPIGRYALRLQVTLSGGNTLASKLVIINVI
jgi:hypothetical protein